MTWFGNVKIAKVLFIKNAVQSLKININKQIFVKIALESRKYLDEQYNIIY